MKIVSKVIRKTTLCGGTSYHVTSTIDGGRAMMDCQPFDTRQEALDAIPALDLDLKESIEAGILVL